VDDESGFLQCVLGDEFHGDGDGVPGEFSDELSLARLEDIPMRRWHWMSLAFLAVALVRLWMYARARRMWLLFIPLFAAVTVSAQSYADVTIYFQNLSSTPYSTPTCPGWSYTVKQFDCSGHHVSDSTSAGGLDGLSLSIPANGFVTTTHPNVNANGYTCSGSWCEIYVEVGTAEYFVTMITDYTTSHIPAVKTIYLDGSTCSNYASDTCLTNICQSYHNSFGYAVNVWAQDNNTMARGGSSLVAPGGNATPCITVSCSDASAVGIGTSIQPGQYTNVVWSVKNDTPWKEKYTLTDAATGNKTSISLNPGESGTVTLPAELSDGMSVQGTQTLDPSVYNTDMSAGYTNVPPNNDFIPGTSDTNGGVGVFSPGTGLNTNGTVSSIYRPNSDTFLTNGPLQWSSNSSTPPSGSQIVYDPTVNATLQAGFNKQFSDNVISEADQAEANKLLQTIATNRSSLDTSTLASNIVLAFEASMHGWSNLNSDVTVNLSNYNVVILTNLTAGGSNGLSSMTNYALESTLEGISNWLGGTFTNTFASSNGDDGGTNFEFAGVTNWSGALAASAGPLDGIENWFSTTAAGLVIPTVGEGGEVDGMVLRFPGTGYEIDFNPTHDHGYGSATDIFFYAKMLIQWLICLYYAKRCMVDARWAISVCNQARGSQNPAAVRQRSGT
jgi:hypothetical protein